MTVTTRFVWLALAVVAAPVAWSKGSIEDGATKSAVCTACHGPMGNSTNPQWPNLAGQNAAYIVGQLKLFHANERVGKAGDANPAMMMPMALTLSDQDMEDVAAYFAAQVPTGGEADPSYWQSGQTIYTRGDRTRGIPACAACHGPVGAGNPDAGYPALRGQSSVYVLRQLGNYASDARYTKNAKGASNGGDNAAIMHTVAGRLSDEDMRNLASYIQGLR
jgi:cytochrome c553